MDRSIADVRASQNDNSEGACGALNTSSIKNNKYTKVAIKRYLYSQVRSNFLRINVDEMALAAYLPVAQFQGRTLGGVFAAARKNF